MLTFNCILLIIFSLHFPVVTGATDGIGKAYAEQVTYKYLELSNCSMFPIESDACIGSLLSIKTGHFADFRTYYW